MVAQQKRIFVALLVGLTFIISLSSVSAQGGIDKFSLWDGGTTRLRGANAYQRIVYPELDGDDFLGDGHIGPPYTQSDFDQLADLGANYVNLSVPGIYTINPPYVLDSEAQTNLDNMVLMAQAANLNVVISFRTGPGRSDFTFTRDGAGVWYPEEYLIEDVWKQQTAQDAWVNMWRVVGNRYKNNPAVVGYDLMVEPNANALLNIYDPEEFFNNYTGSLYDWNQFYPRLVSAIRENDTQTPILIEGNSWGSVYWLNYTTISPDPRVVYVVHNYEPFSYTNQDYSAGGMLNYPGMIDGEYVDKAWLDNLYSDTVDVFRDNHPNLPVAVTEIGVTRWSPNANQYLADEFSLLEDRGLNHAIWMYHANWQPFKDGDNAFDFMLGPVYDNHTNVTTSALLQVIRANWAQNNPVSPPNAAPARGYFTTSPITLTWTPLNWATKYWLQVADSPTFTHLLVNDQSIPASDRTFDFNGNNGTFFWRISARRPDQSWGAWSIVDTFRLDAP